MHKLNHMSCSVYSSFGNEKKQLRENTNNACFAGIEDKRNDTYLYIKGFECKETIQYLELIVGIINKITDCSVVTIDNVKYIKFKFLITYNQSLALLNFIRLLWYSPIRYYADKNKNFSLIFFQNLKKTRYKDPFAKLCKANAKAHEEYPFRVDAGHSNCYELNNGKQIKILSTDDLLKFEGERLKLFFTE